MHVTNRFTGLARIEAKGDGMPDLGIVEMPHPMAGETREALQRQAEGADLAHLKPPHINPSDKVLALLLAKPEVKVTAEAEPVAVP